MRGVNLLILFVFLLGSIVLLNCSACAQDAKEPTLNRFEEAAKSMTGSIDLHGRVVDRSGRPIRDVTIKYFFRELQDFLSNGEIDYERMRVDGDFRIEQSDISAVHLTVLKDGYYSETWSYGFDPERPRLNPEGIERIEIAIVLEEQPVSAPLRKYAGILRTDLNGPISVVEVKRQGSGETWLWKDGEKRDLNWTHVLLATEDEIGSALSVVEFRSKDQRFLHKGLRQGWIRFNDSAEGEGFITYEPGEINEWAEMGMRRMTEAPEGGYERAVEVAVEKSTETIFFFCKVNGHYGKGMVSGQPIVALEDGRQVARAEILIYLNPTGSRDVSFIHN